jgi:acyl dehydratase
MGENDHHDGDGDSRREDDRHQDNGPHEDGDRRYVEDIEVGQHWEPGSVTVTEEEIVEFATQYDPQPIHVDPAAADEQFGGLIASGWHTAAACMRPFATEVLSGIAIVAALGIDDLRWHEPVRPGDTLDVAVTVTDVEPWDDRRGKVTFQVVGTNQDGDRVHSRRDLVIVERRGT